MTLHREPVATTSCAVPGARVLLVALAASLTAGCAPSSPTGRRTEVVEIETIEAVAPAAKPAQPAG